MRSGVIAQKVGMTRIFTDAGNHVPVTVLRLAQCQVVAHRSKDKDGYVALPQGVGLGVDMDAKILDEEAKKPQTYKWPGAKLKDGSIADY